MLSARRRSRRHRGPDCTFAVARDPQRRVRRDRTRLGLRRLPDAVGSGFRSGPVMRALGIRGLSVTMPHKEAVLGELDELSADAELLGAVNCVTRDGDRLVGDSTDGGGVPRGSPRGLRVRSRAERGVWCSVRGRRSFGRARAPHGPALVGPGGQPHDGARRRAAAGWREPSERSHRSSASRERTWSSTRHRSAWRVHPKRMHWPVRRRCWARVRSWRS